ncbi:MAG: hypothetical protein Q8P50_03130 [Bacillota bacterium]|nr:hypothetical protein [Bacillota bacterium]
MQYSVHQLAQRRGIAALVLGAIVVVGYIAYTAYPNSMFVVVAMAILVFSVSAFLFPIRYRLTNRGVYFRNFTSNEFRAWDRFYDYFIYKDAVLLSFDYRTLRGRIQKGFLVYFDAKQEHKQKLLDVIASKITRPARQPASAKPRRRGLFPLMRRGPEVVPPAAKPAETGQPEANTVGAGEVEATRPETSAPGASVAEQALPKPEPLQPDTGDVAQPEPGPEGGPSTDESPEGLPKSKPPEQPGERPEEPKIL